MKSRVKAWGSAKIVRIVACIVLNDRGEVLLLQRHRDDLGGGKWGAPGGHIEPGEAVSVAAARELYEETGLQPSLVLLGAHEIRMPHGAVHMTTFSARLPDTPEVRLDPEEHEAYQWLVPSASVTAPDMLWGVPSTLHDFGLFETLESDPTLADGSEVILLHKA
jgi:8-oxo-dGTP diphosphatase